MRAMILAAGLGKRMRPLTDSIPKPLLKVGELSLIEHQIMRLADAGIYNIVINHFYLGELIRELLGNGRRYGVSIVHSKEPIRLNTAGGIIKSLPKLKDDSFIVVNADIWTDFPFGMLTALDGVNTLAHLVMVENANHNPDGDFYIGADGNVTDLADGAAGKFTFSGISVLHRKLFEGMPIQPASLVPLLKSAMTKGQVSGQIYRGTWIDIGTPERLKELQQEQQQRQENEQLNRHETSKALGEDPQ